MSAIAKRDDAASWAVPRTDEGAWSMAQTLAKSGLVPDVLRGRPEDIMLIMMHGDAVGLTPAQALTSIDVVKGVPRLRGRLMAALVLRSGHAEYFSVTEATHKRASIVTRRRGAPVESSFTFTLEDARRAGVLSNPTWSKYPREMMIAKVQAMAARTVYPDVIMGLYSEAEIFDDAPPRIKAEVVDDAPQVVDAGDDDETLRQAARDYAEALSEVTAWDKRQCYAEIHQRAKAMMDDGAPRTVATIEQAYKAAHRDAPEEQEG